MTLGNNVKAQHGHEPPPLPMYKPVILKHVPTIVRRRYEHLDDDADHNVDTQHHHPIQDGDDVDTQHHPIQEVEETDDGEAVEMVAEVKDRATEMVMVREEEHPNEAMIPLFSPASQKSDSYESYDEPSEYDEYDEEENLKSRTEKERRNSLMPNLPCEVGLSVAALFFCGCCFAFFKFAR